MMVYRWFITSEEEATPGITIPDGNIVITNVGGCSCVSTTHGKLQLIE